MQLTRRDENPEEKPRRRDGEEVKEDSEFDDLCRGRREEIDCNRFMSS